ncbi:MAG TPA: recombinase family protein [Anaerolineae bacterium]
MDKQLCAAIYARVSTDEQADKGYSLPSQVEACQRYAEQNGLTVTAVYKDDYSGASLHRPEFSKLRESVRQGAVNAVIIYCADRLTRNLAHSLILREEFQQAGVERHFVVRGKAGDTAESRMMENIESVFAEYEREKIRERMSRGRWQKARSGKYVCNGKPPFGYKYDKNACVLTIYEPEAKVVRRIYRLYVHGDGKSDPMTLYAVARELSEKAIPTPSNSAHTKHRRKRTAWSTFAVRWILANETYCGTARFGKAIGQGGQNGYRSIEDQVAIPVVAIVERSLWEAAQERMQINQKMSRRNCKHDYLLRGRIKCGYCHSALVGAIRHDWRNPDEERLYYRCNQASHRFSGLEQHCRSPYTSAPLVENAVCKSLLAVIYSSHFEEDVRKAQQLDFAALQPVRDELRSTDKAIEGCSADMCEFVTMLRSAKGDLMRKSIQEKVDECERRFEALKIERAKMELQMKQSVITDEEIHNLDQYRRDAIDGLQNPTRDDIRRFLELLRAEVVIQGANGTLNLQFPRIISSFEIETSPLPWRPCSRIRRM